ncbi:MAG: ThiF family adenylyltransferase [Acidobacteriota bacterium]|nr:ThiF family adenylyltransferase [Blastocatellia bacterium]MDW8412141.1 ThiF family adenylyltransferase [Acidobacteriota bacterium]
MNRYSRQILFEGIGQEGQKYLSKSHVTIVGCGAIGSASAEALARAGVGSLRIIDRDVVEPSNLHRQSLYDETDAKNHLPKAEAAKRRLQMLNSELQIEAIVRDVSSTNTEHLLEGTDLVLDGTDNFETRFIINDACIKRSIPWIYAAAVSSYGLTMTVIPEKTPCLRCIFEQLPPPASAPTCETAGVILPIISSISAIQVTEAIKILIRRYELLHKSLVQLDIWKNRYVKIDVTNARSKDCICCSRKIFDYLSQPQSLVATLCGRNTVQVVPNAGFKIDLKQLAEKLRPHGEVQINRFLLRFKLPEGYELTIFPDARSLIHGTADTTTARSIYAKFVGA